jgi:hypothetical protein
VSRYVEEHRGRFGVEPICSTLGVSASAYPARDPLWDTQRREQGVRRNVEQTARNFASFERAQSDRSRTRRKNHRPPGHQPGARGRRTRSACKPILFTLHPNSTVLGSLGSFGLLLVALSCAQLR